MHFVIERHAKIPVVIEQIGQKRHVGTSSRSNHFQVRVQKIIEDMVDGQKSTAGGASMVGFGGTFQEFIRELE